MIPYARQDITQADIDKVIAVLRSEFLTQGPVVPQFESNVAAYCRVNHAVATNSATSALHIACLALGLEPGDALWTTPISFVASANCGLYCGAKIDFVDIDPKTYNLCPRNLEKKLIEAQKTHQLPKVVVAVHLSGQPCDMAAIYDLSQRFNFKIIEDASHAIGGKYKNKPIGNCQYSDIVVFSFHPVKIITTAEGGMALTNDSHLASRMEILRSHGIVRDPAQMTHKPDGPWYYQQVALGFNYRMTELQAALGISQMRRLDSYVSRRHELAQRYNDLLGDLPVITPWQKPETYSGMHLYLIRLQLDKIPRTHLQVFEFMRENNVYVNLHYIPIYRQPYYHAMDFHKEKFPNAEAYYREVISLPMFPTLTESEQSTIVRTLEIALTTSIAT